MTNELEQKVEAYQKANEYALERVRNELNHKISKVSVDSKLESNTIRAGGLPGRITRSGTSKTMVDISAFTFIANGEVKKFLGKKSFQVPKKTTLFFELSDDAELLTSEEGFSEGLHPIGVVKCDRIGTIFSIENIEKSFHADQIVTPTEESDGVVRFLDGTHCIKRLKNKMIPGVQDGIIDIETASGDVIKTFKQDAYTFKIKQIK